MNIYKQILFLSALLSFSTASFVQAGDIDEPLAARIQGVLPDEEISIIITMDDQLDLKTFNNSRKKERRIQINKALRTRADSTQRPVHSFLRAKNAQHILPFWIFNGVAATLRADQIMELAHLPGVGSVRLDEMISLDPYSPAAYNAAPEWNLSAIGADGMWQLGYSGTGITVASMDTGVDYLHPDLAANYRGGSNSWYDPHGEHPAPHDAHGHGTQTMGVMVGRDISGTGIGVAPDARWIAVKMFDDAGFSSYSIIHQGFQWLLDPDNDPNTDDPPHIVNNSWGYRELVNQCFTEFQGDIQALKASGIAVVFSAGNEGPSANSSVSPANYAESLAVGAVDDFLTIGGFSGRGPSACGDNLYPELVAPGVNVRTADLTFGGVIPNSYANVSGTSFAAPHVSGSMALLLNARPSLTLMELESALTDSATDLGDLGQDNDYGNGLLNVAGAWELIQASSPSCTDADGDGYYATADCGTLQDCNDNDGDIYPGNTESKNDGIDQDCNGYDLSIDIILASYSTADEKLEVEATSSLGRDADLTLLHHGPMKWNRKKEKWTLSLRSVSQDPGSVTVIGIEGSEESLTVIDQGGGGKGGGRGKSK